MTQIPDGDNIYKVDNDVPHDIEPMSPAEAEPKLRTLGYYNSIISKLLMALAVIIIVNYFVIESVIIIGVCAVLIVVSLISSWLIRKRLNRIGKAVDKYFALNHDVYIVEKENK